MKTLIYILAFILSYFGVDFFRRWSEKRQILDIPNERSSHTVPTPKGGGLVIVVVSLLCFSIYQYIFSPSVAFSYIIGALIIASISWVDDIYSVSPIWRFLCHFIAAGLVVWQMGYWETVLLPGIGAFYFGLVGIVPTVLWIVWVVNAYNFMDGIDGIAAVQSLISSVGWFLIGWFWGIDSFLFYALVVFATSAGFLFHNWHPAKVFMGDVGSAFLGFTFAVFPLLAAFEVRSTEYKAYFPILAILFLWIFVFDTVCTLIRRIFKREKIWQAHKKHFYQKLVVDGGSHSSVTMFYGVLALLVMGGTIYHFVFNGSLLILIALIITVTTFLIFSVYRKDLLTNRSQNVTF